MNQRPFESNLSRQRTTFLTTHSLEFARCQKGQSGMARQRNAIRPPTKVPLGLPWLSKFATSLHGETPTPDLALDILKQEHPIDHGNLAMQGFHPRSQSLETKTRPAHLGLAGDFQRITRVIDLRMPRNFATKFMQKWKNRPSQSEIQTGHFDIRLEGSVGVDPTQCSILVLREGERESGFDHSRSHACGLDLAIEGRITRLGFEINLDGGWRHITTAKRHIAPLDEGIEIRPGWRP